MKTIILPKNKVKVQLYSSIKEWPQKRKHELGKLAMMDMNIGDSMDSVAEHFKNFHTQVHLKQFTEAAQEGINLHNNFFYMLNSVSIDSYSFTTYVESIGDDPYKDLSKEGAQSCIDQLHEGGITVEQVEEQLLELKKKLTANFDHSFLIAMEQAEPSLS